VRIAGKNSIFKSAYYRVFIVL